MRIRGRGKACGRHSPLPVVDTPARGKVLSALFRRRLSDGNGRIDLATLRRLKAHDANEVDDDLRLMEIQVDHPAGEEKTGQPAPMNRGGKVAPKVPESFPSATIPG
jgi:hypothetical protein